MASNYGAPTALRPGAPLQTRPSTTAAIVSNPAYQELVRSRNSLAWQLSIAILVIYLAFIFLVAFAKNLLAIKVASTTSVGIILGLVVIVLAFVLTSIYVARANGRFDDLTNQLKREIGA